MSEEPGQSREEKLLGLWLAIESQVEAADAGNPVNATALADLLALDGPNDNRKRAIRYVIHYARETQDVAVCSDNRGYWIDETASGWKEYVRRATGELGQRIQDVRRRDRAIAEQFSEQRLLFT